MVRGVISALVAIAVAPPVFGQPAVQSRDAAAASTAITTVLGKFGIGSVDVGDRFPPGCDNPGVPDCERVKEGYQVVVVWLEAQDGQDLPSLMRNANILDMSASVVVVADDGTRTERFSFGMREGNVFVAFTPKTTEKNFKLFWPGNPEIALAK